METRIVLNPKVLNGKPIVKGTRISVEFILQLLASGMAVPEVLSEYPHLKREDVLAAIDYAAKALKHEEILLLGK